MDDIRDYLKEKFLPEDDATTERIAQQSKLYIAAVYTTNNHPRLLGFSNVNTSSPLLTTIC